MKPFKDMTWYEFDRARVEGKRHSLGVFPRFCQALSGYEFWLNDQPVYKYQLFDWGYTDAHDLINNRTDIRAVKINEYLEI